MTCSPLSQRPQQTQHMCLLRSQRFGWGTSSNSSLMSGPAKQREVDTQERRRRARAVLIKAALWSPRMNERYHPRGSGRIASPGRFATNRLARTSRHRLSAVANSANHAALREAPDIRVKSPPLYGSTSTAARGSLEESSFSHPSHMPPYCQCTAPQHNHAQCFDQLFFSRDSLS